MQKMQKSDWRELEKGALSALLDFEGLAEKKAKIYSKILTEQALAEDFALLAGRHLENAGKLEGLLFGKKNNGEGGNENED